MRLLTIALTGLIVTSNACAGWLTFGGKIHSDTTDTVTGVQSQQLVNVELGLTNEAKARATGDLVAMTNWQAVVYSLTNGAALGATALQPAFAATGTVWSAERLGTESVWTETDAGGTNWSVTVTRSSNVVVSAMAGDGYNGPAVGTVLSYSYQTSPTEWVLESSGWKLQFLNNGEASEAMLVDVPALAKYWFGAGAMPITAAALMDYDSVGSLVLTWKTTTNRVRIATEPTVIILVDAAEAKLREEIPAAGWKNEHYWYIDMEERPRVVSSTATTTNDDAITYTDTTGIGMIDWQIIPTVLRGFPSPDFSYGVSGSAGTINQDGLLTMLSAGLVDVIVSNATVKTAAVDLYFSSAGDTSTRPTVGRVTGSAAHTAVTNIDSRISLGADDYWLTNNPALGVYVRNPACWAAAADLSGVVVSTGGGAPAWHGTLLTTQHIIMAKHAYDGVGTVKRFVGRSGTNYVRTITVIRDPFPGEAWGSKGDYVFGKLNAGLPIGDVAVYPVLPASYTNQFPTLPTRIPALIYSQAQRARVGEFGAGWQGVVAPSDTNRLAHYSLPYSGDSGRPVFIWMRDQLVFAFVWTTAQGGISSPTIHRANMNALLAVDGLALTDADLSGFTEVWP